MDAISAEQTAKSPANQTHIPNCKGTPVQPDLYSLWLLFSNQETAGFDQHVAALATEFGGPVFMPHVTLVSDLPLDHIRQFEQRALDLPLGGPAMAQFGDICAGDSYFQSLYLAVTLPESLARLRLDAYQARGATPGFPPHISLAYGAPEQALTSRQIDVIRQQYQGYSLPLAFLALVESSEDRPIKDWKILHQNAV